MSAGCEELAGSAADAARARERVLIADSLAERARRIAVACSAYGIETHVVHHGAAALEYALAERPGALVAQVQLPLVDGERLAEILQANPHTRGLGILFVGDEGDAAAGADTRRASVVPAHAEPDTIARFVRAMLEKRRPEPAPAEASSAVEGKLAQISLAELIEIFHLNRKSGVIELRQGGRRGAAGRIGLREGAIVAAHCGEVRGEKALYRLLAWRRGSFAFEEDGPVDETEIDRPTRALLREAQRQASEWERLAGELPPPQARVALKVARSSLPNVLHPLTQEVLLVLEVSETVQDVLDRSSYPDYQVLRTLQTLVRRELVELRADETGADPGARGLFAPASAARLRDWLEQVQPREGAPTDAKLVVLASDADAQGRFRDRLAVLPGVQRAPGGEDVARGENAPAGVWPTLRIPVDDEVGIEVFELPALERFAPIWPLATHAALATLFVHAGPVDASVDALRPAVDAVDSRPHARAFHLLLEVAPRERDAKIAQLCQRLGLFDERCVAALASDADPGAELSELLVRLLP